MSLKGGKLGDNCISLEQACETYLAELGRFGRMEVKNEMLVANCESIIQRAQCTALECHILRCLKKTNPEEQKKGITKYMCSYASVMGDTVLPQIWARAQEIMKKS